MKKNVVETFKKSGFDITDVKGNSRFGEYMYAIWHDGVQYSIDYHGNLDNQGNPDIAHSVNHLKSMIENSVYHQKIKGIYNYLMKQNIGDIWVLTGGGAQIQAFFGNTTGYVAILYLEMENKKPKEKEHTLVVNGAKNDKLFDGRISKFTQDGVELCLHKDLYDQDDVDEDYDEIYNN